MHLHTSARVGALAIATAILAACGTATPVATVTATVGSESPSPSPSTSSVVTPTPTVATPAETADAGIGGWYIDFTGVGPFSVDQDAADVSAVTGVDYSADLEAFDGFCASFGLDTTGELSAISALAESDGAYGTVDTYTVSNWDGIEGPLPSTYEGITVGSSFADVNAAYGDDLQTQEYLYDPEWTRAWIEDRGFGMLFLIDDTNTVVSITAGRDPQYFYIEGCA